MKKKIVFLALVCLITVMLLTGCNQYDKLNLTFDKKYVYNVPESPEKQECYVFHNDGTGEYCYYIKLYSGEIIHYKYSFKYFIEEDDTMHCFFDSMEIFEDDTQSSLETVSSWNAYLIYNKNYIMEINNRMYFCEDFLPQIPNYKK